MYFPPEIASHISSYMIIDDVISWRNVVPGAIPDYVEMAYTGADLNESLLNSFIFNKNIMLKYFRKKLGETIDSNLCLMAMIGRYIYGKIDVDKLLNSEDPKYYLMAIAVILRESYGRNISRSIAAYIRYDDTHPHNILYNYTRSVSPKTCKFIIGENLSVAYVCLTADMKEKPCGRGV